MTEPTVSSDQIVPALKVDLFTLNFGDAADSRAGDDQVYRGDGWTIGNHLWIIPPCENDQSSRVRWLKFVAPLPREDLQYRERLAYSDTHDVVQPGGDMGDMEAAFAEQEQDRFREQKEKDLSFGQTPVLGLDCVFHDQKGFISDEFRPLMKCILCHKDPTRLNDAPRETRKFYSMTLHVTFQHDMCVYPSSRGYTYQQLVRGRQVSAARWWMTSALVDQTKESLGGNQ